MLKRIALYPLVLPVLIATIFTSIFFYHSLYLHLTYNSHAFDLGIYTQISYLYSQNLPSYSSLKRMPLLADHFGLILLILSPIYKVFPSPITLLFIQALFAGLSSIPIYLIANDKLKKVSFSILITVAYLSSKGLLSAINFDFHLATISVLPLSLILYCWYFKKYKLYLLALFFSILFKEDIPIFILGLGIYQLFTKQRSLGIFSIIFALLSFYLIKFQIMPMIWKGGGESYIETSVLPLKQPLTLFYILLTNPGVFLDQIFNSPTKLITIHTLLSSFAFFPILSPLFWLGVFPYLFIRFTSNYIALWTNDFHHNANLMPFLAVGAIFAISKIRISQKAVIIFLLFFIFTGGLAPKDMIFTAIQRNIYDAKNYYYIENAIKNIPQNAVVAAQTSIVSHLSNRPGIYLFPEYPYADYIVLDISLGTYPMDLNELNIRIQELKTLSYYQIFKQDKTLIIFKRKDY